MFLSYPPYLEAKRRNGSAPPNPHTHTTHTHTPRSGARLRPRVVAHQLTGKQAGRHRTRNGTKEATPDLCHGSTRAAPLPLDVEVLPFRCLAVVVVARSLLHRTSSDQFSSSFLPLREAAAFGRSWLPLPLLPNPTMIALSGCRRNSSSWGWLPRASWSVAGTAGMRSRRCCRRGL